MSEVITEDMIEFGKRFKAKLQDLRDKKIMEFRYTITTDPENKSNQILKIDDFKLSMLESKMRKMHNKLPKYFDIKYAMSSHEILNGREFLVDLDYSVMCERPIRV
jgi:hypothetical protein